ncbi:MAG: UvrD-helicase domain-containing protein, partial [Lachnospiraceae bacterium]|nr:UvrD-helicase domain-containing protein [Lachnospiraceae bacterium]
MNSYDGYKILDDSEWKAFLSENKPVKPTVTKEQQMVIDTKDSDILVSAAAGSGKTWVLVKRIINRLLNERVDIDKFLIVTFTKAAADEMRIKISDAITDELNEAYKKDNKDLIDFLNRQATLVNMADISTIDSFCGNIVKENFMELGIDPSYRIGDKSEINVLSNEVLDDLLEEMYSRGDKVFNKLVNCYLKTMSDQKIVEIINKLYSFQMSMPDPEAWIKKSKDILKEDDIWFEEVIKDIRYNVASAKDMASDLLGFLISIEASDKDKEAIEDDIDCIDELIATMYSKTKSFRDIYDELYDKVYGIGRAKSLSLKGVDEDKKAKIKAKRKSYRDDIIKGSAVKGQLLDISKNLIDDKNSVKEIMEKLLDLASEFRIRLTDAKKDKLLYDFSDIEHAALKV